MTNETKSSTSRRSGLFIALGIAAVCVTSFLFNGPAKNTLNQPTSLPQETITEEEFGADWPFVYSSGILRCEGRDGFGAVTFEVAGRVYAVNGIANNQAERRGRDSEIFRIVKDGGSIGPMITHGLEACN